MFNKCLRCLSREVDFHGTCYTTDDRFKITPALEGYNITLNSSNLNNKYVKRFNESTLPKRNLSEGKVIEFLKYIYDEKR